MWLLKIQMQVKVKFYLVLFALISFSGLVAYAQEEGQSAIELQELNRHPELNLNDDKTLLMEVDAKTAKNLSANHESTPANNTKTKTDTTKPSSEKSAEDPLSFNFIYFIIQKFKISDIVDD